MVHRKPHGGITYALSTCVNKQILPRTKNQIASPHESRWLGDFQGGYVGNGERFQKREQEEEQANVFKTQKGRSGRNGGAGGKERGRELKSPGFPQLFAEAGTYGGRVFKKNDEG